MIFFACRTGDVIQAFIGLWLVPKYVGPEELGAVLPLQQLALFLTTPLAVVATVFAKFVNVYATKGEFGKVKSFIHDVFATAFILFVLCIAGAYAVMPFFYGRLRIASGLLTFLILLCGLTANLSAIIAAAQQGLKRFKTMSIMNLLGAPIRLVTLLIAMPIRALSGYMLGQATPAATTSFLSVIDIRRALKPYTPDRNWHRDLPEIWRYLWPYALCTLIGSFAAAMTATVYRQRLPELESAAYYMLTRFSDIASFVSGALLTILVPLASEAHEKNSEDRGLLKRSVLGTILGATLLAFVFAVIAKPLLSLVEIWRPYLPYAYLLPLITFNAGLGLAAGAIAGYEFACRRIGATVLLVSLNLGFAAFLIAFTGCEFFRGYLPNAVVDLIASLRLARLSALTWTSFAFNSLQLALLWFFTRRKIGVCPQR